MQLRRLSPFKATAVAAEVSFWAGAGLALYHGDPLLASLLVTAWVVTLAEVSFPNEAGYWILGAALIHAHRSGETGVFFLTAPIALLRTFVLLVGLQIRVGGRRWESFFLGPVLLPGWNSMAYRWRQRGRIVHAAAWVLALGTGVAWTAGLLWCALVWDSWWRVPYIAVLTAFAIWWCGLGVRAVRHRGAPPPDEVRPEATGSPRNWSAEAARMYVEFGSVRTTAGLPPAELDFAAGFTSPEDPRLRLFAADCAEHLLPPAGEAGARHSERVQTVVGAARKRAHGHLQGWWLRASFEAAGSDLRASGRRVARKRGDLAVLRAVDDAASAAYHALCAPTPLEAARYAANAAAVTVDGELREEEHRWQRERLDWYRGQAADPALGV